jgi:phospholipid/cholesterol/gamma-HCH transport system substrate-binding protein
VSKLPGTLRTTQTGLVKLDRLATALKPTLQSLRPAVRSLDTANRETLPLLREGTPIIRDQIRPFARDVQPTVRDLRAATNDLAPVAPRLTRSFRVINTFFNTLAYDPPNGDSFLFWSAWAAHSGALLATTQDAHGPMIRGIVLLTCNDYGTLESIVRGNPQLGMLTRLANFPPERQVCPGNFQLPGEPALDEVPSIIPSGPAP